MIELEAIQWEKIEAKAEKIKSELRKYQIKHSSGSVNKLILI